MGPLQHEDQRSIACTSLAAGEEDSYRRRPRPRIPYSVNVNPIPSSLHQIRLTSVAKCTERECGRGGGTRWWSTSRTISPATGFAVIVLAVLCWCTPYPPGALAVDSSSNNHHPGGNLSNLYSGYPSSATSASNGQNPGSMRAATAAAGGGAARAQGAARNRKSAGNGVRGTSRSLHHQHQQQHVEYGVTESIAPGAIMGDAEAMESEDAIISNIATTTSANAAAEVGGGCPSCMSRENFRNYSLENIKVQILNKLGMKQAPNTTGRQLPKIPPLHHLLQFYGAQHHGHHQHTHSHSHHQQQHQFGMQGDEPMRVASASAPVFKPGSIISDEDDDYHARTERVIAFAQPYPKLRHGQKGQDVQYFRFSEKVMRSKVLKAQLWLYIRGTQYNSTSSAQQLPEAPVPESPGAAGYDDRGGGGGSGHATTATSADIGGTWSVPLVNISVMKVLRGGIGSESPVIKVEAKSLVRRPAGRGGWVSLNVEELLIKWFDNPKENHGVVLHATDQDDRSIVVTDHEEEDGALVPFVELYTADGRKHRSKRTIGLNCDETSDETRCCRYPLTVDFEEFGWDWIIAPKKYEANYCSGECPYVFLQKYPHTHIVHLANPAGTAGPCCAPRKMSAISMLYFDNEFNIIYGLLPGMVVDRCGCS